MVMAKSGHMFSHCLHPIQSSIRTGSDLRFSSSSSTFFGQTATQSSQPLHQALLIVTLNFDGNILTILSKDPIAIYERSFLPEGHYAILLSIGQA
jgi:hypothetical protein